MSLTDAEAVLRAFNLVSYHGELRRYTGTKPIDQVSSASFDDDNTAVLSDAEILESYILMYNYVYGGYRDLLDEDATAEELKALPRDEPRLRRRQGRPVRASRPSSSPPSIRTTPISKTLKTTPGSPTSRSATPDPPTPPTT
ncbi:MAG: hypothetical protein MZU97_24475 [Bacillus subtilis]|nr:hypothetical protein [Bacillus subtilis]